jgi:hypothetical protein
MFEAGKAYRIVYGEEGDVWHSTVKVIDVEMPLIRVEDSSGEVIVINTTSPHFHSAKPFTGNFGEPFEVQINLTKEGGDPIDG